ncbi:MAG: hypothetical protein A2283_02690 [Lentisphaerae bacterium RIFOXYA12_FULL_48_11]|nr:MAG: hypothetical protein A2283_02690 [Lentisphaerae bacterium RIFOXYA12_FULL_48_11]
MIANHIHDALAQVRKLQEFILARKLFRGYSGPARMTGGFVALAGAFVMSRTMFPPSPVAHLLGWGGVLSAALLLNYGGFIWWFLFSSQARREVTRAMPVVDAIPALAVGAVFSMAMILGKHYELFFGTWMCLYGLAHVSYRMSLPMANYAVGIFYITCGSVCLLMHTPLTNPWPMGLVFFAGEVSGGLVLHRINYAAKGGSLDEP